MSTSPTFPPTTPPASGQDALPAEKVDRFDGLLREVVKRYPPERKASAMLPALRLGQEIFGHLSPAVQRLAADRLGTSPSRAEEVATFYLMFHTRPIGRHLVEVCTNVSCCLAGGERLFEHLRRKLGVENGGTSADGRFTVREVECLAACGTGPAMLVDEEMYERLTVAEVDRILGRLS